MYEASELLVICYHYQLWRIRLSMILGLVLQHYQLNSVTGSILGPVTGIISSCRKGRSKSFWNKNISLSSLLGMPIYYCQSPGIKYAWLTGEVYLHKSHLPEKMGGFSSKGYFDA